MKKTRLILGIFLIILILGGCSCNKEITDTKSAYGIVHKDYVGKVTISIKSDEIETILIDEAFLPHTWAVLETTSTSEDIFSVDGVSYPKYIKIADEVLTASAYDADKASEDGTSRQKVKWSNDKIDNLYVYVKADEHAKWYFEALKAGNAYPSDKNGTKMAEYKLASNKLFKSEGGYWEGEGYVLGWKGNISELIKGMIKNEFKTEPSKNDDGKVVFGNITTSATLTDYNDYYQLARNAYLKINK